MRPFRILEHTADVGLEIHGKDLAELFTNAAAGLFAVITDAGEKPPPEDPAACREISLTAEDAGDLLLKWLRELLFYFSSKRYVLNRFYFKQLTEKELRAEVSGWKFDPEKFDQRAEVKAVTYHAFKIQKRKDGWSAQVILDI